MNKKLDDVDKKFLREHYKGKAWDIAYYLLAFDVRGEDFDYIMQGGEQINSTAKKKRQEWIAGAMKRMEERIPEKHLKEIREMSACCLGGERGAIAKEIHDSYGSVEERFQALCMAKKIIGGKAWKEPNDLYYISFWNGMPKDGYHCSCLHYEPKKEAMTKTWCMCCGGHIKHHFETALGVKAECECISSPLNSCGNEPCLFQLKITELCD